MFNSVSVSPVNGVKYNKRSKRKPPHTPAEPDWTAKGLKPCSSFQITYFSSAPSGFLTFQLPNTTLVKASIFLVKATQLPALRMPKYSCAQVKP